MDYKRITRWALYATSLLVLIAMITPMQSYPYEIAVLFKVYPWLDKAVHASVFGVLTGWCFMAFKFNRRAMALAIIALSGMTEIVQPYTGRSASWADFLFDVSGVLIAYAIYRLIKQRQPESKYNKNVDRDRVF